MLRPWQPFALPPSADLETRAVLKKLPASHRVLAEIKGYVMRQLLFAYSTGQDNY